jgi:hypothetical protein
LKVENLENKEATEEQGGRQERADEQRKFKQKKIGVEEE